MGEYDSKKSATPPLINAATNDGTHRLTVRWQPKKNYQELSRDPVQWLSAVLDILQLLFADHNGVFYWWESEDITQSCTVPCLTPQTLRDYISQKTASLNDSSTFVFGLQFCFTEQNPLSWRNHAHTKNILKDNGIGLAISNSTCSSGRLVIAGYILFKTP